MRATDMTHPRIRLLMASIVPLKACLELKVLSMKGTSVKNVAVLEAVPKLDDVRLPNDLPKAVLDSLKKKKPGATIH